MSVYAPMMGTLWRMLESAGLDPKLAIDEKLYHPGRKTLLSDRIRFVDYDGAMARTAALIKDPTLGLRCAQFLHPSHLGALGHAWLASSSLRTALLRAERFRKMFNEQVEMRVCELPDRVRVTVNMLQKPTRPNLLSDAQLAGLLLMCRLNYGADLEPVEVNLKRPEPPDPTPWFKVFGEDLRFGQPKNSLAISAKDADRPLTGSNTELVAIHEDVIRRHLVKLDRNNILNRTRLSIMEQLPSGRVTEHEMARFLNMSKRTLHRRLRENDVTFRSLLMQVRLDLAERYISNDDYTITEIAFLLGYTDTSAFSRAFRNWFGRSPSQAREQGKAA